MRSSQLAERLGLPEQTVQRYEATDYAGVRLARLVEIADALEATIHHEVRLSEAGWSVLRRTVAER